MHSLMSGLKVAGWLRRELSTCDDVTERLGTLARLYSAQSPEDRRELLRLTLLCDAPADRVRSRLREMTMDWESVERRATARLPLSTDPLKAAWERDRLESIQWSLRQVGRGQRLALALSEADRPPHPVSPSNARLSAVAWQEPRAWWGTADG